MFKDETGAEFPVVIPGDVEPEEAERIAPRDLAPNLKAGRVVPIGELVFDRTEAA